MIKEKIRNILLKYWDPIGISHIPTAKDEYDSYMKDIILYMEKEDYEAIAKYLKYVEIEIMGASTSTDKDINFVIKHLKKVDID